MQLSKTIQMPIPPPRRVVSMPVGILFNQGSLGARLMRLLIPHKSPFGSGLWIPFWIPFLVCALPAIVCRKKMKGVRPCQLRVRRTGVSKALRFDAVVGTFLITGVLSSFVVEATLAAALQNSDVVAGMHKAWGIGEQNALLLFISLSVAIGVALAFAVDYVLAWKRVPTGRCQKCDYDLRETKSGVCPECGHRFDTIPSDIQSPGATSLPSAEPLRAS